MGTVGNVHQIHLAVAAHTTVHADLFAIAAPSRMEVAAHITTQQPQFLVMHEMRHRQKGVCQKLIEKQWVFSKVGLHTVKSCE